MVVPSGLTLIEVIGAGTVFHVAVVTEGGLRDEDRLICKRLRPRVRDSVEGRAAMVREARFLERASHPALPRLVRVGADSHGPFLLETRTLGASLSAIVEAFRSQGREVPPLLVRHIAREAARTLAELAELRDAEGALDLVHGDIAPDQLLLAPSGQVGFIDFGAARFRGMDASLHTSDRGTLPYVAPEVARGDVPPNAAADVYSLSATLLYLAVAGPLVSTLEPAAMLAIVGERGLDPSLVDNATAFSLAEKEALRRALEPDPSRRFATARAFAEALHADAI